jgi:hypothetical protein
LVLAILGLWPYWARKNTVSTLLYPAAVCAAIFVFPGTHNAKGVGIAIAAGLMMHDLGDMITRKGCPLLAPVIPLAGRRWFDIRIPKMMRIESSGTANTALLYVFTVITIGASALTVPNVAAAVRDSSLHLPSWVTTASQWDYGLDPTATERHSSARH